MVDAESVYLLIFVVSLGFTLASFALGVLGVHFPGGGHAPGHALHPYSGHVHGHLDLAGHNAAHAPTGHFGANGHLGHPGAAGHLDVPGHAAGSAHPHGDAHAGGDGISPFNLSTILAFLTWFGGAGYLLTAYGSVGALAALLAATCVGLVGASIVFFFLVRVLLRGQTPFLRDEDYELEGTIGRLSVGIRAGHTGEVVFSKAGSRRVASARSADGEDIPQGTEVVVVHQEGSIAYVQRFEQLLAEEPRAAARN